MSNPADEDHITVTLPKDDYQRLSKLLSTLKMVDGWCRINRAIAKFLIFGIITALIVMSQTLDAVKNLIGLKAHP